MKEKFMEVIQKIENYFKKCILAICKSLIQIAECAIGSLIAFMILTYILR